MSGDWLNRTKGLEHLMRETERRMTEALGQAVDHITIQGTIDMGASDREKGKVECASCGARRDGHNRPDRPCPRFVEPVTSNATPGAPRARGLGGIDLGIITDPSFLGVPVASPSDPLPGDPGYKMRGWRGAEAVYLDRDGKEHRVWMGGDLVHGTIPKTLPLPGTPGSPEYEQTSPAVRTYVEAMVGIVQRRCDESLSLAQRAFDRAKADMASTISRYEQRIVALEKIAERNNFDPKVERAVREKIDWTQVPDDEDCLGDDGTRDVPQVKPRVIF